jgi:hypothetical protein
MLDLWALEVIQYLWALVLFPLLLGLGLLV